MVSTALALDQPQGSLGALGLLGNRMALKEAVPPGPRLGYAGALSVISWEPVHFPEAQRSINGHTALGLHKERDGREIVLLLRSSGLNVPE